MTDTTNGTGLAKSIDVVKKTIDNDDIAGNDANIQEAAYKAMETAL